MKRFKLILNHIFKLFILKYLKKIFYIENNLQKTVNYIAFLNVKFTFFMCTCGLHIPRWGQVVLFVRSRAYSAFDKNVSRIVFLVLFQLHDRMQRTFALWRELGKVLDISSYGTDIGRNTILSSLHETVSCIKMWILFCI
ncbi:MAG: hypothetical protein AYK18_03595 [Theionarchaea archaeon DG-70]|nr:MAG: hypothetical protein AYK18_03595 [Theionarchaea archaeon DG-70]